MAAPPDPTREYQLIEKLEFRIAAARDDDQFQDIIQKFLPALVLKLASETERNRNLAIKVCQYVKDRLKISRSIQVPIPGLFKNFQSTDSAFVRRFSLMFIEQGLPRVPPGEEAQVMLPEILRFAVPEIRDLDAITEKLWSIAFNFFLFRMGAWEAPERGSKDDLALKETFALSKTQCDLLSAEISRFLLFDPKVPETQANLSKDFLDVYENMHRLRTIYTPRTADFLFSAIFNDEQRLIPATIMSIDPYAPVASTGDIMFKQCNFDLEADLSVDRLFDLYSVARPKLQTRILTLLSRSQKSTERPDVIYSILEKQLSSPDTGLESAKLRAALFNYLNWAVRISSQMHYIAQRTQSLLKDYIELQGWPSPNDRSSSQIELRARAYESIGLLAGVKHDGQNTGQAPSVDLINWLFTSLRCDPSPDIRGSIEEALSRVMNFIPLDDAVNNTQLRDLLMWNVTAELGDEDPIYYFATINSTRYTAVRFANKCLPFSDITARFIDILAIGHAETKKELADEGERGLDPYWHRSNQELTGSLTASTALHYPEFADLMATLFDGSGMKRLQRSEASLSAAVIFCRNILMREALNGTEHGGEDVVDWRVSIDASVLHDPSARKSIRDHLDSLDPALLTRFTSLALRGIGSQSEPHAEIAAQLASLVSDTTLQRLEPGIVENLHRTLLQTNPQRYAARCLGIINSLEQDAATQAVSSLKTCAGWRDAIGAGAVKVRGYMLAATHTITRVSLRTKVAFPLEAMRILALELEPMILHSSDLAIKNAAIACMGSIALCSMPSDELDSAIGSSEVIQTLQKEAKKQNEQAVATLGRLINYKANKETNILDSMIEERLFPLHEIKQAEFHFALGEALAVAVGGFQSLSTTTEFDVRASKPQWGFHEELQAALMDKLIETCRTPKPTLRKAAAIWLLSMIQYCGETMAVKSRLRECQASFARLLTDRDEIVQETGSRGLGIVYEKGDKNLQDDLVRDLVQSFTGAGAKMSGTVNEDTQLFEAGTLPTEGGASVTTYKDIVSLATEMGDPSLVYKFMNLASNNAIWSSRAAFGKFGLSSVLADSTYLAENKKFYPKLFRYRFDPNPNVQRSMNDIWKALVKDSAAIVDQNFELIIEDLLKSVVSGREWRAREASCAAIADLVSGRDIEKLEKYLDEIWNVSFKVLDDVKETVRVAAMKLCRTLTNMLVRNLETGQGNTKRAATLLGHAMPFLMKQMEGGTAQEVQQYATVTLLEVVKKAPPRSLQPYAPVVLETLINSLSSLEHESINYLHLNADKYGLTADKLDQMRVSSVNASPVTEAVDRCLESLTLRSTVTDPDAMEDITMASKTPMGDAMSRLENSFKAAIGLPSRVGLSRVMVTLVVRHPSAFRPFADRFAQLHRKHVLDRNATISIAFSTSLGYLMRLVSETEIEATSKYAQKLYFESQDLSHRSVAGEILQSISKTSNDVFMNFASTFLPFAFIGRNDTDEQVRDRFDPPWKDNIGGSRAVTLYLQEISSLIMLHIKSSLWPVRHACCFTVADLVTSLAASDDYSDRDARLVWPLMEEALNGKTWTGKEKVVSAYPKWVKNVPTLWTDRKISDQMVKIAVREAKRQNVSYRPHAIQALGDFAATRGDLDLSQQVIPYLTELCEEITSTDAMEIDSEGGDARSRYASHETVPFGLC
jgi:proteasome component ECM29